jgi:cytochrome c biogenesis protein CcmG/thiol:disulfide interchange protein DsbE
MAMKNRDRWTWCTLAALLLVTTAAFAQTPPAAPTPPPSPVSAMRNKLSAGDLLSAESILEVYRAQNGEDGAYLAGLSWLARGAFMLGDVEKAKRYTADVRARCADSIAHRADPEKNHNLEIALGAAIEVEAQMIARSSGAPRAAAYVRRELGRIKGPVALRTRLNKRLDLLTLTGSPAPELVIEDFIGERPPTLAALRGKPVVLFLWAEWCSDCKGQAATLARVKARHAGEGLQVVAITRYYDEDSLRAAEKARVDSVWKAAYSDVGTIPILISTASMERYGGSSTPTFVFVNRAGIVRWYTPTRLTETEFDRALAPILR